MTASTHTGTLRPEWYVLPASRAELQNPLPVRAPLAAQYLYHALPRLVPSIRAEVRAGHVNSRRVRLALAQLAEVSPLGLNLSRRDMDTAHAWLSQEVWNRGNA
jgi:hypothetical protein